jgi:hypothetical protein
MDQKSNARPQKDPTILMLRELAAIKRLLAVLLMKAGTPQSEIAAALQLDQGDLSRMLPARQFKPFDSSGRRNK